MTPEPVTDGSATTVPTIFISYRRQDTGRDAYWLHKSLTELIGAERVFIDLHALKPGMDWRAAITDSAGSCGVLIALIGTKWLSLLNERSQRNLVEPSDDVARAELELALSNSADITVVPVLVDDATMPRADELPRSLRALSDQQAAHLRLTEYDEDLARLVEHLMAIASRKRTAAEAPPAAIPPPATAPPAASAPPAAPVSGRHGSHYDHVIRLMTGENPMVVMLGSSLGADVAAQPDDVLLAADLAHRFDVRAGSADPGLARVAQYVDVMEGRSPLCLRLREQLSAGGKPGQVHRFLAGFGARLEELGRPRRHLLILTTNYDTSLERAFDAAKEPYDLAVYLATGSDRGRFVHLPWGGRAATVSVPNSYYAFPIGDDLALTRTLIVKIHGAVDHRTDGYAWQDNYVITEDNYIDYLSGSPIETLVPFQILQTLRSSHCLFLGYDVSRWNLRVFLKRIWGEEFGARSWAVQGAEDEFQREVWEHWRRVDVLVEPLSDYVGALGDALAAAR